MLSHNDLRTEGGLLPSVRFRFISPLERVSVDDDQDRQGVRCCCESGTTNIERYWTPGPKGAYDPLRESYEIFCREC
jgi:hypothetical protein